MGSAAGGVVVCGTWTEGAVFAVCFESKIGYEESDGKENAENYMSVCAHRVVYAPLSIYCADKINT